ncbi:MAG TPA: DUF5666 domain-containing protein [Terriglobales bacterium]|jgi:hypothetical protein|nr:DUF5666 domain-containing protein [Terriglobales bacterium]
MKRPLFFLMLLAVLAVTLLGCGGTGSSQPGNASQAAAVFITGEDAPLPSVLAFNVTVTGITLNSNSTSVPALTSATTIDFARLLGLRTLVGFNTVQPGTYTSATINLSAPQISYLDMTTTPPSVGTVSGTLTTSSVTVAFPQPLVVRSSELAGLHMEFDLRQSLQLDGTGQVTGVVNPHIDLKPVVASDPDAQITDLRGGLVSVNVAGSSFVIQRPGGHQLTIVVNSKTQFNGSWSLSNLAVPAFVEVDGTVQADGSILASGVEVVAATHGFLSGRIVNVNPSSGPAQTITLLVGEEMPDIASIPVGFPVTLDVSQVTDFRLCFFDNWFTNILFDNSSMVVGQRIFVGGTLDANNNFVPQMISLRRQGVEGDLVQGSVNIISGNRGSFQIQNNSLMGFLLNGSLTIQTGNATLFVNVNGLPGLQSGGAMTLRVHGLMLKDQTTGNPQLWAGRVRVLP